MIDSSSRWYNHPIVNIFSLVVGLIGVLLASIFYYESRAEREPYYSLEPERTVLVNRALAVGDKLTVAYENNPTVGDISVVQLYFWNAGDKPIHSQDVLEPLKLVLDPGAQILETSVLRQSRGSIVDFHVSPDLSQDGKRTNTASMSFRILEKRDGAAIQLVYSGGPDVPLRVTGSIEGAQITQLQDVGAARVGPSGRFFTRRSLFLKLEFVMAITLIFSLFASRVFETILAGQSPWTAVKSGLQSLVSRGRVVVLGSFLLASAFYYFSLLNFRTVPQVLLTR